MGTLLGFSLHVHSLQLFSVSAVAELLEPFPSICKPVGLQPGSTRHARVILSRATHDQASDAHDWKFMLTFWSYIRHADRTTVDYSLFPRNHDVVLSFLLSECCRSYAASTMAAITASIYQSSNIFQSEYIHHLTIMETLPVHAFGKNPGRQGCPL